MRAVFLLVLGLGLVAPAQDSKTVSPRPIRTVRDGVLDEIVLYAAKPPADPATSVLIRKFAAGEADLGTGSETGKQARQDEAKTMTSEGPRVLAERLVATLTELGPYTTITTGEPEAPVPPGSIVIDGKFTKIDPGSRAKRYLVGFGAGKSTVTVTGSVKDQAGVVLATFKQTRHGVMGMGGGDSLAKLLSDSREIGVDIAKFLSTWAKEKSLK
jgi:hypothetical protein